MIALAPDNLPVLIIAGAHFDSAKIFMETSVRMSQSKKSVPKKESGTVLMNKCLENIDEEKRIKTENHLNERNLNKGDVLVMKDFLGEKALKYSIEVE